LKFSAKARPSSRAGTEEIDEPRVERWRRAELGPGVFRCEPVQPLGGVVVVSTSVYISALCFITRRGARSQGWIE
jgi:hypothetical protein